MKLLLLVFSLLSLHSFGQYSDEINTFRSQTDTSVTLPKQFKQETRQTKLRFLRKQFNDTSSLFCQGKLYAENFSDFRSRYDTTLYVHDFDLDGDYDILFFGRLCPGHEGRDVVIFFKNKGEYTPQELGNWLVGMKATRKHTELAILNPPVGADDIQLEFMYYEAVNGVRDSLRQFSHITFGLDRFDQGQALKTDTLINITQPLLLYNRPDNTNEDDQFYLETENNPVIGSIKPGATLHAYDVFEFQGKRWFYVLANTASEIILSEEWRRSSYGEIGAARGWICLD